MALDLPEPRLEPELEHTRNLRMPSMFQESWVEKTLVIAWVGFQIQVVLRVLVMVEEHEVSRQLSHLLEFYGDDHALVVVVDPLYTKENSYLISISIRIEQHDYRNITFIHWT